MLEKKRENPNDFNRKELSLIRVNADERRQGKKKRSAFYAIYLMRNPKLVKISLDSVRKKFFLPQVQPYTERTNRASMASSENRKRFYLFTEHVTFSLITEKAFLWRMRERNNISPIAHIIDGFDNNVLLLLFK
jgi:hypothetical protein